MASPQGSLCPTPHPHSPRERESPFVSLTPAQLTEHRDRSDVISRLRPIRYTESSYAHGRIDSPLTRRIMGHFTLDPSPQGTQGDAGSRII